MAMERWGVWSEQDGGFAAVDEYSEKGAAETRLYLIGQEETPEDKQSAAAELRVMQMCVIHDEQPYNGCEDCAEEEEEELA